MSYSCDEVYEVYQERVRKARKLHKCDACERPIRAGDLYCLVSWVFEGSAESVKRCGACQTTHKHLRGVISECGLDGEMWPDERLRCGLDYVEEWQSEPPAEIAALPFISDDERGRLLAKETP